MSTQNQLSYNRLVYNRLVYNHLAQNELAEHRITATEMLYYSLDDLESTAGGRDLLVYIARCALPPDDILVAEHDGVSYPMEGLLGLAPEWEHGGLSVSKAHLISACLLAHVNAYGVSVAISLRSPGHIGATAQERIDYPVYEATFYGDVFGPELRTYACLGGDPELALSHSSARSLRVCADDTPDCEIEAVGFCRDVCETRVDHYGWTDCWGGGVKYEETMSTYLVHDGGPGGTNGYHACPDDESYGGDDGDDDGDGDDDHDYHDDGDDHDYHDDGDDHDYHHDDSGCVLSSDTASSVLDCSGANECDLECEDDAYCTLTAGGDDFRAEVKWGAIAEVDCHGTQDCRTYCKGLGTRCAVDCTGVDECDQVKCRYGATCAIDCTGSNDCGFYSCHGGVVSCPGDVWVCNGSCP